MKQSTVTPQITLIIPIDSSVQSDLSICTFCSKKSVLPNSPEVHSIILDPETKQVPPMEQLPGLIIFQGQVVKLHGCTIPSSIFFCRS